MAESRATRSKPKPASRGGGGGRHVRIHPPANDNRTGRVARIAAIVAAAIALLWLFSD